MKFTFKVYYKNETDGIWEMSNKFKVIKAKNEKEAIKKFAEKYPNYIVTCVF